MVLQGGELGRERERVDNEDGVGGEVRRKKERGERVARQGRHVINICAVS